MQARSTRRSCDGYPARWRQQQYLDYRPLIIIGDRFDLIAMVDGRRLLLRSEP
jgi:hypothetical protein